MAVWILRMARTLIPGAFTAVAAMIGGWHGAGLVLAQGSSYSVMAVGDVRAIDREAGSLTVDHGPLLNLSIPAAVRVFQVADKTILDTMKVGDEIRFIADDIAGQLTITRIETGPVDGHGDH